jgi:hypothetical protein
MCRAEIMGGGNACISCQSIASGATRSRYSIGRNARDEQKQPRTSPVHIYTYVGGYSLHADGDAAGQIGGCL